MERITICKFLLLLLVATWPCRAQYDESMFCDKKCNVSGLFCVKGMPQAYTECYEETRFELSCPGTSVWNPLVGNCTEPSGDIPPCECETEEDTDENGWRPTTTNTTTTTTTATTTTTKTQAPTIRTTTNKRFLETEARDAITQSFTLNTVKTLECGMPYFGRFGASRRLSSTRIIPYWREPHQWPWHASIRFHSQHVCGGAFISPRHILTAAHCFASLSDDPLDFEVWLGKDKKDQLEPDKQQRIAVEDIKIHPDCAIKAQYDSDLAILRLAQPIVVTNYTLPVCLPSLKRELPEINMTCYVSGFGTLKGTGGDFYMKHAELPILEVEECGRWNKELRTHLTNNMVCAGFYENGDDSCQGDQGGPLVCLKDNRFWLSGVASFGMDCSKPQRPSAGVYVRVANFIEWIENTAYDLVLP